MKAPRFWYRPPGWQSALLKPLAKLWTWGAERRQRQAGIKSDVPVVCVGNLTVGGTGKTPTVIALLQSLDDLAVHVVSRGYGGSAVGPLRVDPEQHSADLVGDEPLLIAQFGPVWVAKSREQGVAAAQASGAELIIFDDGFQNPAVQKDLSIVVVDAKTVFGNRRVMPAGPLREPIDVGLARADAVLLIGSAKDRSSAADKIPFTGPIAEAQIQPLQTGMDWADTPVIAFAGIGHPEKFFETLDSLGAKIIDRHAFADHAAYRSDLLGRLSRQAKATGAQLVTTEKDAVRLPDAFRRNVIALPVRLEFTGETDLVTRVRTLVRSD